MKPKPRRCANVECGRTWAPLDSEGDEPLCPTCRRGMEPLSTKVGGQPREDVERRKGRA